VIAALWSATATAAAPALRGMLRRRLARGKEIEARLPERYGTASLARPPGKLLWLHAASVGETVSALPMIAALPPQIRVLFTTGTVTSATLLATRLNELALNHRVLHQFVPLDVPAWAARFLDHWRPDAACFLESELWPNLLAAARSRHIPMALINARLSPRSATAWSRMPGFASQVLGSFAWVAAQSAEDAERLRRAGAVLVDSPGNLKFAAPPLPAAEGAVQTLLNVLGGRPRWLAASTHPHDDAIILQAHRALAARHPNLLTTIVPRHPERGAQLAETTQAPRRSLGEAPPPASGIWIADTLGELGLFYRCFPLVLMGKSFAQGREGGGQNPWEPAQLGCAIVTGPAMGNFPEAVSRLSSAGALLTTPDPDALIAALDSLLSNPAQAAEMGQAARQATATARDLPAILAARLTHLMEPA
jgi:3-deoxy-D-manno-octulosonic-acid transferase